MLLAATVKAQGPQSTYPTPSGWTVTGVSGTEAVHPTDVPLSPTPVYNGAPAYGHDSEADCTFWTPPMLGDQLGGTTPVTLPGYPTTGTSGSSTSFPYGRIIIPSVRDFKIAENESPRPLTRFYLTANYYIDVDKAVNRAEGSLLQSIGVYRAMAGLEYAFLDGNASVGLRLPVNELDPYGGSSSGSSSSSYSTGGGTSIYGGGTSIYGGTTSVTYPDDYTHSHMAMGDLTAIFKYAFLNDRSTGNVLSGGVAVTFPTGPASFADYAYVTNFHSTTVQPFVGYIWNAGRFYLHGFASVDVPTDNRDVTILYNDVGVGYWLFTDSRPDVIVSAIVPTVELHFNNPLNHRGVLNNDDPAGTPDVIDATAGVTFQLLQQGTLGLAFTVPLTGPKPFDYEVMAQLNWRFGGSRR